MEGGRGLGAVTRSTVACSRCTSSTHPPPVNREHSANIHNFDSELAVRIAR